ncbi:hypothetical protein R1flu_018744 [Riccia fluitans]|uniref:Uncharacterized protein n=1 Tax=Riccia fluitans TaxID=41844 RepID=A0ABD1ZJ01_9MARC
MIMRGREGTEYKTLCLRNSSKVSKIPENNREVADCLSVSRNTSENRERQRENPPALNDDTSVDLKFHKLIDCFTGDTAAPAAGETVAAVNQKKRGKTRQGARVREKISEGRRNFKHLLLRHKKLLPFSLRAIFRLEENSDQLKETVVAAANRKEIKQLVFIARGRQQKGGVSKQ